MTRHNLRFPGEADAIALMPQYRYVDVFGGSDDWILASVTHALDPIGTIYGETGNTITVTDSDGGTFQTPEMVALAGWHCNLILIDGELPDELAAFAVFPASPRRVWA